MSPPQPFRILIVDDAPVVREALRMLFEAQTDLVVVGEAADGAQALLHARELKPDAVILDVELPEQDGFAVARGLKQFAAPPAIIFLSVHLASEYKQRALDAGADDYVEKASGYTTLLEKIRATLTTRQNRSNEKK